MDYDKMDCETHFVSTIEYPLMTSHPIKFMKVACLWFLLLLCYSLYSCFIKLGTFVLSLSYAIGTIINFFPTTSLENLVIPHYALYILLNLIIVVVVVSSGLLRQDTWDARWNKESIEDDIIVELPREYEYMKSWSTHQQCLNTNQPCHQLRAIVVRSEVLNHDKRHANWTEERLVDGEVVELPSGHEGMMPRVTCKDGLGSSQPCHQLQEIVVSSGLLNQDMWQASLVEESHANDVAIELPCENEVVEALSLSTVLPHQHDQVGDYSSKGWKRRMKKKRHRRFHYHDDVMTRGELNARTEAFILNFHAQLRLQER